MANDIIVNAVHGDVARLRNAIFENESTLENGGV